jgi:RNase P subunit RPR2
MDHLIIRFTCEKCKTTQEKRLTWRQTAKPGDPTAGKRDKALVPCQSCGHEQLVEIR